MGGRSSAPPSYARGDRGSREPSGVENLRESRPLGLRQSPEAQDESTSQFCNSGVAALQDSKCTENQERSQQRVISQDCASEHSAAEASDQEEWTDDAAVAPSAAALDELRNRVAEA